MLARRGATIVHGPVMQTGLLRDADATLAATRQALAAPVDVGRAEHRDRHAVVVRRRRRAPGSTTSSATGRGTPPWSRAARRRAARRSPPGSRSHGRRPGRRTPRWSPSCAHAGVAGQARGGAARRGASPHVRRRARGARRRGDRRARLPVAPARRPRPGGPAARRGRRRSSRRGHVHLLLRGEQRVRAVTGSRRPPARLRRRRAGGRGRSGVPPTRSATHGVEARRRAAPGPARLDGPGPGRAAVAHGTGCCEPTGMRCAGRAICSSGPTTRRSSPVGEARLLAMLVRARPGRRRQGRARRHGPDDHAAEAAVARLRAKLGPLGARHPHRPPSRLRLRPRRAPATRPTADAG